MPVPPPETTSPPTSLVGGAQQAIDAASTCAAPLSTVLDGHEVALVAHHAAHLEALGPGQVGQAAGVGGVAAAAGEADVHVDQHLADAAAARRRRSVASRVDGDGDAGRAVGQRACSRRGSSTSLASSRSSPSPARGHPDHLPRRGAA